MPRLAKEISEGVGFSRSSQEGVVADSQQRIFRVILDSPSETFDIQQTCGVSIGDELRAGAGMYCVGFDARYEGSSRLVLLCTFQFQTTAGSAGGGGGSDPKSKPPDIRPSNYTTSTSLVEVPKNVWALRTGVNGGWAAEEPAINPAGDMYDGVTALEPVVTINITQFEQSDPTRHLAHAGSVNSETIALGSLSMKPGTVMFRGISNEPVVEAWGGLVYRGWKATYEFAYRRNTTRVRIGSVTLEADIGWDVAVPVTGFNCRAFAPNTAAADEDIWGQPLQHKGGKVVPPLLLPTGVDAGERVRAMVKVFEYEDGGTSQTPSASPVPLKLNGRPLKTHDANGDLVNRPLVYAYKVQPAINITQTLGLRAQ
jgi:hypothetical protein